MSRSQCLEAQEGNRLRSSSPSVVEGNAESRLIQTLQDYANRLDNSSRPEFDLLVVDINDRVIANESMSMMSIVTVSAYKLMDYIVRHPEQREAVQEMNLGDWGTVRDLFVVGAKVKAETVESVISNVDGKYALLEALEESKSTFPNEIERIRIDELISDLETQLALTKVPLTTRMSQIHQVFSEWFARYAYLRPYLLDQTPSIDRWGSLTAFLDVAGHFYRVHTMNDMFAPNGTMDSSVVNMLQEGVDSTPVLTRAERTVFRDFTSKVKLVGDDPTMLGPKKLIIIRDELRKLLVTKKIRSVRLSDEFGTFGDLLDVNNFMSCSSNASSLGHQALDLRKRRDSSAHLASRPATGGDCELIASLLKRSSQLTAPQMIKLDVVLFKVNRTILNDENLNRTEALARSVFRIREAIRRIDGLSDKLEFADIGQWGTLHELFVTATVIKSETIEFALVHLVTTLEQFSATIPPEIGDDTSKMISDMMSILAAPTGAGSGPEARYSVTYLTLHEYLIRHPEVYERLRDAKIPEWGNVGMVLDVLAEYYRLSVLDKLFQLESRQSALARDLVPVYGLAPDFINRVSEIASDTSVMDLWKLEMIVREFRSLLAEQPDLNTKLRVVPIGGTFLFGTFGDLIDLYYFKTMKAGNVRSRTRVNRVESPPSSEAPVQDNDVPVFPDNKVTHQDVPVPGKGDCEEVQQLFDRGSDHFYPLTRSLSVASDQFERPQRNHFRSIISRIHNRLLVSQALSSDEKLKLVRRDLKEYIGFSLARSNLISNIPLGSWGTVKQLFACQ
ncbi:hypothetical protein QR680_014207 [Steinernema hermaphroditum]|uniref:Uncharacterized protein n=1 Tax=Steinernema hermaphroditum TaxID=289476 RepID=A0AA39IAT0_9BILA|nr:hypothetical protein QR680_014207 [Steinernema hermaphroditum]